MRTLGGSYTFPLPLLCYLCVRIFSASTMYYVVREEPYSYYRRLCSLPTCARCLYLCTPRHSALPTFLSWSPSIPYTKKGGAHRIKDTHTSKSPTTLPFPPLSHTALTSDVCKQPAAWAPYTLHISALTFQGGTLC